MKNTKAKKLASASNFDMTQSVINSEVVSNIDHSEINDTSDIGGKDLVQV